MIKKTDLLKMLDHKRIKFKKYEHEALYAVENSSIKRGVIQGDHTKNLFLKNKKNFFYLFSCEENSVVELRRFSKSLGAGNLSFAREEYLIKYLGVKPGSVSPYALLNDIDYKVDFYLEDKIYNSKKINFHPLINTSTITVQTKDFLDFMIENKKKINIFSLDSYKIIKIL